MITMDRHATGGALEPSATAASDAGSPAVYQHRCVHFVAFLHVGLKDVPLEVPKGLLLGNQALAPSNGEGIYNGIPIQECLQRFGPALEAAGFPVLQCQLVGAVNPIGKLPVGSNNRGQRVTPPVWYPHPIVLTVGHKGHHPRGFAAHLGVIENM